MYTWMVSLWFSVVKLGRRKLETQGCCLLWGGKQTSGVRVSPVGLFSPAEVPSSLLASPNPPSSNPYHNLSSTKLMSLVIFFPART